MSSNQRAISTPFFIRWQRLQHQLVPFVAVVLGAAVAWRLWREAPRITAIGQVDFETIDLRSPADGTLADPPVDKPAAPRLLDSVIPGQVLARIHKNNGEWQDVTAPLGGQIVKIHYHAGQNVNNGQAMFTIAGDRGLSITTYVRSDQRARPEPGMAVDVRERSDAARTYRAVIEHVGPQYEPIPAAHLRDRKAEEWGLPVTISVPQEANLKPGELVYIGWLPPAPAHSQGDATP